MPITQLAVVATLLAGAHSSPTPKDVDAKREVGDDSVWALISEKRKADPEVGDDSVWALISEKEKVKREVGDDSVWALISEKRESHD